VRVLPAGIAVIACLGTVRAGDAAVLPADLAAAEQRLAARFASRGLSYPPRGVALVALKTEARLELWVNDGERWNFVRSYLIRASSGALGPKLAEGDHQVPEGVYRVEALNPNSTYHLSLRIDYPNDFDRDRASEDGRERLGGNIMIHGGAVSDGCLPVGDEAIEEIFALVDRVGAEDVPVIVSPLDLRRTEPRRAEARAGKRPAWLPELYARIARALEPFAVPGTERPPAEARAATWLPALYARIAKAFGPFAARPADASAPARRLRRNAARCTPYDAGDCVRRCGSGDVGSCARAGLLYEGELGSAADATRAWSFLRRACDDGDAFGCAELARLYLADDGPERDAARAAELADASCEGGDGHGCSYLAGMCADRVGHPVTPGGCGPDRVARLRAAAVAYLQADCRGWHAHDCATLAAIYYPGDPRTAFRFAAAACDGGDPGGCYTLARVAEDGGDAGGAARLYARACQRGHPPACERSGEGARPGIAR
jgi:TPR repeat protein